MFCPDCHAEFVEGIERCPDCGTVLVAALPGESEEGAGELTEVFRSADAALIPVLKSVLEAAGIPHVVQGDEASGLFPLGDIGGGGDRRFLAAMFLVPEDRAEEARTLLEQTAQEVGEADPP